MKNVEKLRKEFLKQYELNKTELLKGERYDSEKIELDNLDWARLVTEDGITVMVENEHGSLFELDDLSNIEIRIFRYNLV